MASLLLVLLLGCGAEPRSEATAAPAATATAATADPSGLPAFVNDKGELACPVMGDTIASPDRAAGHTDFDGKRYYFCCNSCEHLFAENPEAYADGRHLVREGIWAGGTSEPG